MASRYDNWPLDELLVEAGRFGHVDLKRIQYVGVPLDELAWECEIRLPTHLGPNVQVIFHTRADVPRAAALEALAQAREWAGSPQRQIDRDRYLASHERGKQAALRERRHVHSAYHEPLPDIDV